MHNDNDREDLVIDGLPVSRRAFLGFLSGAVAAGALLGPQALFAQSASVLRVAAPANPSSLDPATGGAGSDHVFLFPLYDTLITWEFDTLKAQPGLATSWKFTDPRSLVLTLKQGVSYHDGTAFDAESVKYNLDRNRSDERSNIRADLSTVESVEVTGPHEVTLHLIAPDTALPLILSDRAGMMVSPTALEKNGGTINREPVGAGQMRFVKWADGDEIVVERNPDYHQDGKPQLDGIEFKIITDSSTRLRSVISGQAGLAYHLDGRQKTMIDRMPRLQGESGSTVYCYQLYLNMAKKPLTDLRVRQAINYAINRDDFIKATMSGAGEPAYMNLPSGHWAFAPEVAELYPHDPQKARALLAEAGYPDGIELDMRGYNDQSSVQKQELLLAQFAEAGIRGRFRTGTIADMSAAYFGSEKTGDLLLSAWTGRPDPSLSYTLMYSEDSYFNAGRVAPPEGFNEALRESRSTDDIEKRHEALKKVQRIVMENALVAPLAFREGIVATTDKVQGFESNLLGKPKFNGVSVKG